MQTRSALRARSTPNTAAAVTTAILGGAERASGADGEPGATSRALISRALISRAPILAAALISSATLCSPVILTASLSGL